VERAVLRRVFTVAKIAWYIVVLVGVVAYLYGLYASRGGWSFSLAGVPEASFEPPFTVKLRVEVEAVNPSGYRVFAKSVWLRFYLDDVFVGDVFIPYLVLEPGVNRFDATLRLDLRDAPCAVLEAWAAGRPANLTVKGWATVTVYAFGALPVRDATLPIEAGVAAVEPPPGAAAAAKAAGLLCRAAEAVEEGVAGGVEGVVAVVVNATRGLVGGGG